MKLIALMILTTLTACATVPSEKPVVVSETVEVQVPITQLCNVEVPKKPVWMLDDPSTNALSDSFERMTAALKEIEQRRVYEAELEAALKHCVEEQPQQ